MTPEEQYGVIKAPDSPLMAKAAEMFRGVERRLEGSPAEFILPGGGIATVLEKKAYGQEPTALDYGFAAFDAADATPFGKVLSIFGGIGAKAGKQIQQRVNKLREQGLEGQALFDAQQGQKGKGYYGLADGKFRFEIDTTDAKFQPQAYLTTGTTEKLDNILNLPDLYEQYPDLKNVKIKKLPEKDRRAGVGGRYDPTTDTIELGVDSSNPSMTKDEMSSLLHEVQHAVQQREGFEQGASSRFLYPNIDQAFKELEDEGRRIEQNATVELMAPLSDQARSELPARPVMKIFNVEALSLETPDVKRIAELLRADEPYGVDREALLKDLTKKYEGRLNAYGVEYGPEAMSNAVDFVQGTVRQFGGVDRMLAAREKIRPFLTQFIDGQRLQVELEKDLIQSGRAYTKVPGEIEARTVQSTFMGQKGAERDVFPPARTEKANPDKAVDPSEYIYPIGDLDRPGRKVQQKAMGGGVGSMAPVARNMFRGYDIRRGVGAYAPYTRSA